MSERLLRSNVQRCMGKLLLNTRRGQDIERFRAFKQRANQSSDPERDAPESGGRVGGYNMFWFDIVAILR